ncbi:hypothetical protein REO65_004138 [Klebsiella aerogenes]|nr:hypothetical protein [Klebsiella aerogenes]
MSESVSYFDKVISLINAVVPVLAIYFAQRLWHAKNIERAHQAANDFLDEMTSLPMRVMLLETEMVRGLVRAESVISYKNKNEFVCELLRLMDNSNKIRLSFFNSYERVVRRGINIKPSQKHMKLEKSVIEVTEHVSKILQNAAEAISRSTTTEEYREPFRMLAGARIVITKNKNTLNEACAATKDISFDDYFSFPSAYGWFRHKWDSLIRPFLFKPFKNM